MTGGLNPDHGGKASLPWRIAFVLVIVIPLIYGACTVTPRQVRSPGASFDESVQNSGFIGYAPDGSCILTPHAKERYDALVRQYGTNFVGLRIGDGLTLIRGTNVSGGGDGDWLLDAEHCAKFGIMNAWRLNGR